MNLLYLDPSLACTGWLLADKHNEVLSVGSIATAREAKKRRIYAGDDDARRVLDIVTSLHLIEAKPVLIWSEQPTGSQSARAAKANGLVLGMISTLAFCTPCEVRWVQPNDVKKALTGKVQASKDEMVEAASAHIPELLKAQTSQKSREAVADAYGVFRYAVQRTNT